jgi:hypothetical protein
VGLAWLVSTDFHVPFFHCTCPGYQVDASTFSSLTEDLLSLYREITDGAEHTTIICVSCFPASGSQKKLTRDFP